MKTKGLLSFLLLSILLLYLTCEVEGKRGGGGSRGGSRGGWGSSSRGSSSRGSSWFGGSSSKGKSKSSGSWFGGSSKKNYGSSSYNTRTYQGKSYAGGYGQTWGPSASSWSTTSGLSKFGTQNRWGYSGGHRFYYVGYHPCGIMGCGYGYGGYGGYGYGHHHGYGHGSRGNNIDYGWEPMSPWTVMFLVWLGLFSAGFLAWLIVYCKYKS